MKKILFIIVTSSFLIGCDGQDGMGSNPLRAKARDIEHQQEQAAGREQETAYGSAISDSFKKNSE
ncbi:MAG: hypothetical protein ACJA2Y_001589 [Cycloclasticus pugetii]|jgi:hypothetical protein|uniref:Lipoprotein n=2 Tax=Cycloclasticus TaxID=34067 RepID=S5TW00_9GAMM|nr:MULTISPECIES: hypothetical protein [Cycloclasticus]AGS39183.1 hypothetical protein CYCME_0847 [Cycloclasticus zancles 78-ME]ATI02809.1 hypothetical protein CPC19_04785 [Cycloclasticus sp. PY97N]EPD13553.1 hypothetical protein L196_03431 [Cycloclasticus pugetii]MDF1828734.1 hypothetical protein [Cycloclasticus pugetii]